MSAEIKIIDVHGREILDSRGNPTIETTVTAELGTTGRKISATESVPSGASTGQFEAVELRDGEVRYFGLGVKKVAEHVNGRIKDELLGMNVLGQTDIDRRLVELDGTDNKGNLGANALLGVSLACASCAAKALELPLFRYLGGTNAKRLPRPMMNVVNGGVHAKNALDFQEFMIVPVSAESFSDALRMGAEVYHYLKLLLQEEGMLTAVGDEGGFAPELHTADEVFYYLTKAVEKTGYKPGEDIAFAMDAAASELYDKERNVYLFPGEEAVRSPDEMIALYEQLINRYPLISIEDGLDEEAWEDWQTMKKQIGNQVMFVGDDLFVTNTKRIRCGIEFDAANAVLIKLNQIGTLTEAMDAIELCQRAGWQSVISHRSGETESTFIADLCAATNSGYIKSGAPCRSERTAKYNELLRIEESLKL